MVTFRKKLLISYLAIFLLLIGMLYLFTTFFIAKVYESNLIKRTQQVVDNIQQAENLPTLLEQIKEIEVRSFFRIILIDPETGVVYDTHQEVAEEPESNEALLDQPELKGALTKQTGYAIHLSSLFQQEMAYTAVAFPFQGKQYILQAAFPYHQISELVSDFRWAFLLLEIAILLLFGLFSWIAFHYFTRPIQQITRVVNNYSSGPLPEIILDKSVGPNDEFRKLADTLNFLAKKIQQQISTLTNERNEKAAILESLGEGVVAVDGSMTVTYINHMAEQFFSIERTTILGNNFRTAKQPQCDQLIHDAQNKGETAFAVLEPEKKPKRYLDAIAVPLGKDGAILVLQDKTSLHKVVDLGKDLIANTSHELKTPITIIRGFSETLHDHPELSPEVVREITEMMVTNCQRMDTLVKNLLALAAVDESLPLARLEECNLVDLAQQAKQSIHAIHSSAQIDIEKKGVEPFVLMADSDLLLQALLNLLDNGVKYSEPPAQLSLILEKNPLEMIIHVSDKGMGIPAEDLDHIFDRFYAVNKTRSRSLGGSGLGLSIVERIVEKQGGKITVTSTFGKGTTFTLTFPI